MKKVLLLSLVWLSASLCLLAQDPDLGTKSSGKQTTAGNPDVVKVYVKQDPGKYQSKKSPAESQVEFAVQLAATSRPITDKSSLKAWEDLGPVYIQTENGLYKVRIGPYNTQEGAKAVLLKAKERGRSDAFIVVQQGIENHKPYEFPAHTTSTADIAASNKTETEETVVSNELPAGDYKVQLVSYLHPGGFNTSDIDQYGPLESYRKGEWTIMLIGGFKTKADAQRVKDIAVSKGFQDATVVMDQDGILVETK